MRVGFIGCVESSRVALEGLLDVDGIEVVAVVTKEKSSVNSDFVDLSPICMKNDIPYHFENPCSRDQSIEFLNDYSLDLIFCIGWSYLLGSNMLQVAKQGVIGFHPAKLPQNRGRHPIIWALALGLEETASTMFKMDEGADSGPIVSQEIILISSNDTAETLYKKIKLKLSHQIKQLAKDFINDRVIYTEQEHTKASYWRKRSRLDGMIDFRMSDIAVHNLVRALAPPYPCAEIFYKNEHIRVIRSSISNETYSLNVEPGKVLKKNKKWLLVKTSGSNSIWIETINETDVSVGDYI